MFEVIIFVYVCEMDVCDLLCYFCDCFFILQYNGQESFYFCGNFLGLQFKIVEVVLKYEFEYWKIYGVEGYFWGDLFWMDYYKFLME